MPDSMVDPDGVEDFRLQLLGVFERNPSHVEFIDGLLASTGCTVNDLFPTPALRSAVQRARDRAAREPWFRRALTSAFDGRERSRADIRTMESSVAFLVDRHVRSDAMDSVAAITGVLESTRQKLSKPEAEIGAVSREMAERLATVAETQAAKLGAYGGLHNSWPDSVRPYPSAPKGRAFFREENGARESTVAGLLATLRPAVDQEGPDLSRFLELVQRTADLTKSMADEFEAWVNPAVAVFMLAGTELPELANAARAALAESALPPQTEPRQVAGRALSASTVTDTGGRSEGGDAAAPVTSAVGRQEQPKLTRG